MTRPEVLGLIPARGGSKSIPRKNLMPIAGKPLMAHSIAQALASRHITRTIVSTDDEEIAAVARAHGAEVPFLRPAAIAGDRSTDLETFAHALAWLRDREAYQCACVVHLRPTGPVRRVDRVDEAIARFLAHPDADSLRSVSPAAQSPFKMWRRSGEYLAACATVAGLHEPHSQPRQALPDVFWQNGYVDVVRPSVILERGSICGDRVLPFVIHEPIYELDYPEQIARAEEALLRLQRGEPLHDEHPVRPAV